MNDLELRGKLYKKLANISNKIGALEKDGKNKHSGWSFISSEKMLSHCRSVFDEKGVYLISAIVPELTKHEENGKTSSGNVIFKTTVTMRFNWIDCDTGYKSEDILFSGQDQDQAKSFSQAITDCHKRFIFKAFNVSSANDKDPDVQTIMQAKELQSRKHELKRKFTDLYKGSSLQKGEKDLIIAEMKIFNGEDITTWNDEALEDLEVKLKTEEKKEKPSFDKTFNKKSVVDELED